MIKFACMCLSICDILPNTKAGQNLEHQLSKSGTAPAVIYGEAQAAESPADFIHIMKFVLKEIMESRVSLRIICEKPVITSELVLSILSERNELIAIFLKSIETAKRTIKRLDKTNTHSINNPFPLISFV